MEANTPRLSIEMFPADHGDCFLVRCEDQTEAVNILVDGGPSNTFSRVLLQRLETMASANEQLDLVVVTHVDNDHIQGIIEFIERNGPSATPKIIGVGEVWHNSYRHLCIASGQGVTKEQKSKILSQCRLIKASEQGLIGAKEGSALACILQREGYNWNSSFQGGPIKAGASKNLGPVSVRVLSPDDELLNGLLYWWQRELLRMGVSHDAINSLELEGAFEAKLMQEPEPVLDFSRAISASSLQVPSEQDYHEDRSKVNCSSMVIAISVGVRSILLLGDAPTTVLERTWPADLPFSFDCVKVSHHGSRANTSPEFLKKIRGRDFLISGNGKYGNPHVDTLLRLVSLQPGCNLVFNYPTPQSERLSANEAKAKFGHSTTVARGDLGHFHRLELRR